MSARWHKAIAVGVIAFVVAWACSRSAHPDVSLVVRGFVTNSYTFFPGEYVCAIIDVTNASKHPLACFHRSEHQCHMGSRIPKSYYSYREGGFRSRGLSPRSGFSFEAVVSRDTTNEITVDIIQFRVAAWPFRDLPNLPTRIEQKLPELFRTSSKVFSVTTTPFTVRSRLQ
jgi:hypothetical protein